MCYGGDPGVEVFVLIILSTEIHLILPTLLQAHDWTVDAAQRQRQRNACVSSWLRWSVFLVLASKNKARILYQFSTDTFKTQVHNNTLHFITSALTEVLQDVVFIYHKMAAKATIWNSNLQHIIGFLLGHQRFSDVSICKHRENIKTLNFYLNFKTHKSNVNHETEQNRCLNIIRR